MKTSYRNTDLDLTSTFPLDRLLGQLESAGMVVLGNYQGKDGDWNAVLEIVGEEDDHFHEHAEATIIAMIDKLEGLPEHERRLFEQCKVREFNTAYDVGDNPMGFNEGLSVGSIIRMAALKISLRTTLYPSDD